MAIIDYNKALSIDANIVDVYNNRGNARSSQGDLTGALLILIRLFRSIQIMDSPTTTAVMFDSRYVTSTEHSLITKRLFRSTRTMATFTTIAAVREELKAT